MKIFLLRHASPNLSRPDMPYDLLPGPELLPKGEQEARDLAEFLKPEGLEKLYYSPFDRAAHTAKIVAESNQIPAVADIRLAEWRMVAEPEASVRARMHAIFEDAVQESAGAGPIGLVSHGGPIALLLLELGLNPEVLAPYRRMFDTTNPLPPAGAWKLERVDGRWSFELVFKPDVQ